MRTRAVIVAVAAALLAAGVGGAASPSVSVLAVPPLVTPELGAGDRVFPVHGAVYPSNTFGALRADTPGDWHHGDDLFAPVGTPVLACADGVVFSVGWNTAGGWRLWLRDRDGNEFYYAHLSGYSDFGVDGAIVHAGDVLGFVGDTGDAAGTPPHLHFEVHPLALLPLGYDGAVDPDPYLERWRRVDRIPPAATAGWGRTPDTGATLIEARDIAAATGLDPASLRRTLSP